MTVAIPNDQIVYNFVHGDHLFQRLFTFRLKGRIQICDIHPDPEAKHERLPPPATPITLKHLVNSASNAEC